MSKRFFILAILFLSAISLRAQDVSVRGKVTDANDVPLAGVSVMIKGTTNGTNTDADGSFALTGPKGCTLVFSFIGMLSQEAVFEGTHLKIVMKDDKKALEEVVVIG